MYKLEQRRGKTALHADVSTPRSHIYVILRGFCILGEEKGHICVFKEYIGAYVSIYSMLEERWFNMRLELYNDLNKYMDDIMDIVAVHEIQNNMIISNCLKGREGSDTSNWLMAAVKGNNGAIRLVAIMTPPFSLVLYEVDNTTDEAAVELFVKEVISLQTQISGVLAEKSLSGRFAAKYAALQGMAKKDGMKMRIYRLDEVGSIAGSSGRIRLAQEQ